MQAAPLTSGDRRTVSEDFLKKLSENVYLVEGERNGRFPSCHGFLFTGSETVLIDAGMGEERIKAIDSDKRIDILLVTHSHPDHISNWALLKDRHILLPQETPDAVRDMKLLGERLAGTEEGGAIWVRWATNAFGLQHLREPDGRYKDADVLEIGGVELEAIHAPGHIQDHYCFLERKSGTLLTTDIDLTGFGPWYGNAESDIESFEASVRKVMSLFYNRVCSSHKAPIEGDATVDFKAFLGKFARQRNVVRQLCRTPSTLDEIVNASPFYGNAFQDKAAQRIFEGNMVSKNLELLVRDGLVEKSNGRFRSN
jgi:hydroxyacylglutathione hydrolase